MKLKTSPSVWAFCSCLAICSFLAFGPLAELAHCAERPKTRMLPADDGFRTTPATHAVIHQSSLGDILLTEHPRHLVFVKSSETQPKSLLAKVPVSKIGTTLLTIEAGPEARAVTPYVESGMAKAAHIGQGMLTGHGSAKHELEFDLLPSPSAGTTIYEGPVEILIPLNTYLPSTDAKLEDAEPVLLKLTASEKDQARVISTRSILVKDDRKGRFDWKGRTEKQEGAREEISVPITFTRLADHIIQAVSQQPLTTGEYALIFRRKAPSGQNSEDVVLRSPLAALHRNLETQEKVPPRSGELLAFDFRVIPSGL